MFGKWHRHPNLPDVAVRYLDGFDGDNNFARQKVQDIEPIINDNTRERNETQGWNSKRTGRKAASIPATVYYDWIAEWQKKGLLDMKDPDFSRKANDLCLKRVRDSDYGKFRI